MEIGCSFKERALRPATPQFRYENERISTAPFSSSRPERSVLHSVPIFVHSFRSVATGCTCFHHDISVAVSEKKPLISSTSTMSRLLRGPVMVSRFKSLSILWQNMNKNIPVSPRLLSLLCFATSACTPATSPPTSVVTQSDLHAEINRYVCAAWLEDVELYEARFADTRCATAMSSAPRELQDVVAHAVADTSVLVPLAAAAYDRAYAGLEAPGERTQAQRDAIVRAAYWEDSHLGPVAVSRSAHYLAEQGVDCTDCARLEPVSESLSWAQFAPYLNAYLWPARADGEEQTHIHVCSAQNGVETLGLDDPVKIDAGFLTAIALAEDETTQRAIAEIAARNLPVEVARNELAVLLDTPEARTVICRRLEQTTWFTGIVVTDCNAPLPPGRP